MEAHSQRRKKSQKIYGIKRFEKIGTMDEALCIVLCFWRIVFQMHSINIYGPRNMHVNATNRTKYITNLIFDWSRISLLISNCSYSFYVSLSGISFYLRFWFTSNALQTANALWSIARSFAFLSTSRQKFSRGWIGNKSVHKTMRYCTQRFFVPFYSKVVEKAKTLYGIKIRSDKIQLKQISPGKY